MALSYTPSFLYRFPSTHSTWHGFLPPFAYKDGRPISRDHTPNRTCPSNAMHRKRFDTTWIYMSESHIDAVVRTSCILHYIAFKPDTQLELHGQNTRCKHAAAMLSDTWEETDVPVRPWCIWTVHHAHQLCRRTRLHSVCSGILSVNVTCAEMQWTDLYCVYSADMH